MVKFTEEVMDKEDHIYVEGDPARIYRGLRELLVEEFDIDRVSHREKNEFNVSKPQDKVRLHAFKEKSPHTVLRFKLSIGAKPPGDLEQMDRPDDILKASVSVTANVVTVYPGGNPITWRPEGFREKTHDNWAKPGLKSKKSSFQKTKLYEMLVGIWYNKFYSKEIARYEEEAEEITVQLFNLMREKFGIEKTIRRSGASQYKRPWG